MSLNRLFLASVLALVGVSANAFAQSSPTSASSGSSSSPPPCEDACCFKQSVVDGKVKFECVSNWCQASCELVYPTGKDGKPDLNKKPTCGCQAAPPPVNPPPVNPPPVKPPEGEDSSCREGKVCKVGRKCVGKFTGKEGSCKFNLLRGGCYCETGPIISNPVSPISEGASAISGAFRSLGGR
jgi:hypothetical protein